MPSRALAFGRKDGMDRRSRSWILIAERFTVTQGIRERSSGRFEDKDTGTVSAVRAEASAHGRRTRMGVTRGVGYADHHNREAVVMSPPLMPFFIFRVVVRHLYGEPPGTADCYGVFRCNNGAFFMPEFCAFL